jgi:hypothetical protein
MITLVRCDRLIDGRVLGAPQLPGVIALGASQKHDDRREQRHARLERIALRAADPIDGQGIVLRHVGLLTLRTPAYAPLVTVM